MTLGRPIRIHPAGRWLTALAAASLLAASARAQDTVPIHFSKPFEPILSTNLSALVGADKQKTFQELLKETDARGVSGLFREDTPIGLLPTPDRPRMSAAAAQKYRDAAERKKNWAFTIENDAESDPKLGKLMKFLDADAQAEADRQRSIYEKFYARLERENQGEGRGSAGDAANSGQNSGDPDSLLSKNDLDTDYGNLNLPGIKSGGDALSGTSAAGEARKAADSRPRDPLSLAARRDALNMGSTRQATDFKDFERESSIGGLTTPSQRARLDAYKSMFESKPTVSASAFAPAKASSPLSSALSDLGLPSAAPGSGFGSPASKGSFIERFDSQPGWKPAAPVSTPLPSFNTLFPSTPSRNTSPFSTVPTRRQ